MSSSRPPEGAGASVAPAPTENAPGAVLAELQDLLRSRKRSAPPGSYSATLVGDPERVARKVVEEAYEVAIELQRPAPARERVVSESADLLFHLLAALVGAGVSLEEVLGELARRRGSGR